MNIKYSLLLSVLIGISPLCAQNQISSKPVGFEKLELKKGFNYLGLRLLEKPVYHGNINRLSGKIIKVKNRHNINTGNYLLEVTSGLAEGTVIEASVTANLGLRITLGQNLSSELAVGDAFTIREPHTLASIFGEFNEAGLTSTGASGTSDQVFIPDGNGGFYRYNYSAINFAGDRAWKNRSGNIVNPNLVTLNYTDTMIINAQSEKTLTVEGHLKLTPTSFAITRNVNYLASCYPVGSTLESAFGATNSAGLISTGSSGNSDQIWMPDGSGGFDRYNYSAINFAGDRAWKDRYGNIINPSSIELTPAIIIINFGDAHNIETSQPSSYNLL